MRLARKIILMMVATFLALLVVLGYRDAQDAVRQYEARLAADMTSTGRALRPSFTEVWRVEGRERALALVQHTDDELPDVKIRWLALGANEASLMASQWADISAGKEITVHDSKAAQLFVYVPALPDGAIQISRPLAEERVIFSRVINERLVFALAFLAGALAVSMIGGIVVVGRPMRTLVAQAHRIGKGQWSERLDLRRKDEIGELAEEMNGMCEQLEEGQRRVAAEADARVRAVEQLRHADRLTTVGTLASGVAHELGTPLSIIAGRAKIIAADVPSAEARQSVDVILGQTERMTRIVRGLLDFARRKPVAKTPIDLRDVATRTLDLLAPLAKKAQVELRLDDGAPMANVEGDAAQLEQVVTNIVINAVHAMKQNGGVIRISTAMKRATPPLAQGGKEAEFATLTVTDDGEGIAPENIPRLFEPFFTTKDVGEGTGLGLSVAYGIVQEHGGFIDVESKPGAGTSFTLYFPKGEVKA